MFNFLKRKKAEEENKPLPFPSIPCPHTWKDFPWYVDAVRDISIYSVDINIYEPYVCAHCKERKDILLLHHHRENITSQAQFEKLYTDLIEEYKDQIKPKVVVEDMVNDFIYVDPEKLEILRKIRSIKNEGE